MKSLNTRKIKKLRRSQPTLRNTRLRLVIVYLYARVQKAENLKVIFGFEAHAQGDIVATSATLNSGRVAKSVRLNRLRQLHLKDK